MWDCLILYFFFLGTKKWDCDARNIGLTLLLSWMFASKFIKLLGHYIRYPVDFLLLPVSIIFGYLHGLIKAEAMLSLNVVCGTCTLPILSRRPTLAVQQRLTLSDYRQHGVLEMALMKTTQIA